MNKEELHKEAEGFIKEKYSLFVREDGQFDGLVDWPKLIADFHLHQTKKMLEDEYFILRKALEILRKYRGGDFVTEVVEDLVNELKHNNKQ